MENKEVDLAGYLADFQAEQHHIAGWYILYLLTSIFKPVMILYFWGTDYQFRSAPSVNYSDENIKINKISMNL
jgi:hypothetical protein